MLNVINGLVVNIRDSWHQEGMSLNLSPARTFICKNCVWNDRKYKQKRPLWLTIFLNGQFPATFFLYSVFQYSWQKTNVQNKFWLWLMWTMADLWCRKLPLYQLSHNHSAHPGLFCLYFLYNFKERILRPVST